LLVTRRKVRPVLASRLPPSNPISIQVEATPLYYGRGRSSSKGTFFFLSKRNRDIRHYAVLTEVCLYLFISPSSSKPYFKSLINVIEIVMAQKGIWLVILFFLIQFRIFSFLVIWPYSFGWAPSYLSLLEMGLSKRIQHQDRLDGLGPVFSQPGKLVSVILGLLSYQNRNETRFCCRGQFSFLLGRE